MIDQFSPEERSLIERLQNAPQPSLSESRFEAIRTQMLNAMDAPPLPAPHPGLAPTLPVITAVVAVIVVVIVVIVVFSGILAPRTTAPSTVIPSLTALPAVTPTPTAEATLEATEDSTPEATVEATEEVTPEATPESTEEGVIVIEGPVKQIDGNLITIYGVTIQLNPDDPLLKTIQIGDVIRVEGDTSGTIITAITVTYVNVEVNIDPSSGEVWRDDGLCDHPPPDWAPANGWRRRCQGQTNGNSGNGNPNGNGKGMGNGN